MMDDDELTEFPVTAAPNQSFVLHVKGRLTKSSAPGLRDALSRLVRSGRVRLVLDLTDVDSIDSAALGSMISGVKSARQADGDLRIVGPSLQVAEVLRLTQLEQVLKTYSSIDEAYAGD